MKDVMLIIHFLGLTMGLGTGFAHGFLAAATKNMSGNDAMRFRLNTLSLRSMGNTGLVFLVVSGLYLVTPYWENLGSMPWLIAKLSLVLLLIIVIALINNACIKAKKGDAEKQFKRLEILGKSSLLIGIGIVIAAVRQFH